MAFTIEPGLYIRQSALDTLPATAESRAFIDRVTPAVRKYTDLGIRIEDSFLLDDAGLRNLSSALPKTIEDVEAVMKGKK
jgi:Xaa-Pro aminopeptidase